jgi:hypothetical protein
MRDETSNMPPLRKSVLAMERLVFGRFVNMAEFERELIEIA